MKMEPRVLGAGALAAAVAAILDQKSKDFAFTILDQGEKLALAPLVSLIPGWNEGTAFGIARGTGPWLLILIALLVTAWLFALLIRSRSLISGAALGAAIGGALANVADRMRFGAVRDFIDVHWNSAHWPTFNMADVFVVTGLLMFLFAERAGKETAELSSLSSEQ